MPPRKPAPIPLSDAIASSIKLYRGPWTQAELAQKMTAAGFAWSRSTVAEVEGAGRGRGVTFPELLGLAQIFGRPVAALLGGHLKGTSVELVPGGPVITSLLDLVSLVVSREIIEAFADEAARKSIEQERERLQAAVSEQMHLLADDLGKTLAWITERADESIFVTEEDN